MKNFIIIIFLVWAITVQGQIQLRKQSVDSGGALVENGTIKMLFSIGEVVVAESGVAAFNISEGFIRNDLNLSLGISDYKKDTGISLYPNPSNDYITLNIAGNDPMPFDRMSYQLFDINGKLIKGEKITNRQSIIKIGNLEPANYFVKVIQGNKEINTLKITKL